SLRTPPPPSSPLFPYTTLFRSVLIELKASHRRAEDGYQDNIRDYRDTIPQLFWANGFVIVSNGSEAKLGASFAAWEHYTDWKKIDRKSTRLNSSHVAISYAVFC